MGQGNVKLSDTEDNPESKEDGTPNEQQIDRNSSRSGSNNITLNNSLPQRGRYPAKINCGSSNPKSFHKPQTDNKSRGTNWQESNDRKRLSEKDYNERIIRTKEKLLKEQEETIRQQAKLIETQNLLLEQRKSEIKQNHQNANSSSVPNNEISHQYSLKPLIETTDLLRLFETHMNVRDDLQVYYTQRHSHGTLGQDNLRSDVVGNNYFVNQVDLPNPQFQNMQDYSNQTLSNANSQLNQAIICFPIHHNADVISSPKVSHRPIFYSSHVSNFNTPPKHSTEPIATGVQTKLSSTQYNRTEKRKMQKDDSFEGEINRDKDANSNEAICGVLKDLEKETNFVLNNLNYDKNEGECKLINRVAKKNPSSRNQRHVKSLQGIFRCPVCLVSWKSKISHVGASQKCRNCNVDVSSRIVIKHLKNEQEISNQTATIERISEIDN